MAITANKCFGTVKRLKTVEPHLLCRALAEFPADLKRAKVALPSADEADFENMPYDELAAMVLKGEMSDELEELLFNLGSLGNADGWANDYYMSLGYVNYTNQHTVLQPFKIGMYDCEKFGIWFDNNKTEDRVHFRQVEVEYRSKSVPRPALVRICFLNRFSDTIAYLCNSLYVYSNVPYRWGPDRNPVPFHVKQEEAIEKAIEYASMFGVSNLTDTALFKQSECGLNSGEWKIEWTRLFNGYATWRGVSVSVADLPGAPLGRFHNTLVWLPEKMPTRIVLTPERAKAKAHEYMKKYFPFKDVASRMVCTTNWLQYAIPDYNFTPHGMDSTDYVPKRDAIHLAYYNAFGSTNKDDNPSGAIIYVDAETGEMLGGYDNGK